MSFVRLGNVSKQTILDLAPVSVSTEGHLVEVVLVQEFTCPSCRGHGASDGDRAHAWSRLRRAPKECRLKWLIVMCISSVKSDIDRTDVVDAQSKRRILELTA